MAPASRTGFVLTISAVVLVIALQTPATVAGPPPGRITYTLTDLGTLGGARSLATFINKHGQVAGGSLTASGETHAFFWDGGGMRDLGPIDGYRPNAPDLPAVQALNDRGQVVVNWQLATTAEGHAFLWTDGALRDLGTLPGGRESWASGLNNRGQVIGWSNLAEGGTGAFLWEDGVMTDLGTLGGTYSQALLINDAGQVAGISLTALGELRAFIWADGHMTELRAGTDGSPCNCHDFVSDMNASGQVVGIELRILPNGGIVHDAILWENGNRTIIAVGDADSSYFPLQINDRGEVSGEHVFPHLFEGTVPFFWRDGSFEEWDLGGFGLSAAAMNQDGQVVGEWKSSAGGIRGYTWSVGTVTDLGGPSTSATDVNDRGLIVGWAYFQGLGIHAALWTPVPGAAP